MPKTLDELIDRDAPAWPDIYRALKTGKNSAEILHADSEYADKTLVSVQASTGTPLGAVIHESGGILFDGGWLRLLGCAYDDRMDRDVAIWNRGTADAPEDRLPGALLVGDDVAGGFFAINRGAFDGPEEHVFYLAPDTLEWEDLGGGYASLLTFAIAGDLEQFYAEARWPNWREEIASLSGDDTMLIYPFAWMDGPPVGQRQRRVVPIVEWWSAQQQIRLMRGGGSGR